MKSMYFTDLIGRNVSVVMSRLGEDTSEIHAGRVTHFVRETNDTNECFIELDNRLLLSVRYIVSMEFDD